MSRLRLAAAHADLDLRLLSLGLLENSKARELPHVVTHSGSRLACLTAHHPGWDCISGIRGKSCC